MKKVTRWILALLLVGAVAGGVWWFRRQRVDSDTEAEVIRTAETIRDTLEIAVSASGSVEMERRVDITFQRPGTVRTISVEVGDRVSAGEELARLDDETLTDALQQAELTLAQAQLDLETALEPPDEDEIALAQLSIREATQAMEIAKLSEEYAEVRASVDQTRARELASDVEEAYETYLDILDDFGLPRSYAAPVAARNMEAQGNIGITQLQSDYSLQQAQSQWQSAYQRYQQAERDLANLLEGPDEDQIRRLQLQIEQAEIQVEQARADREAARLTAPIAGIVSAVNLQENTPAPVARPAMTLLDDANVYVRLSIDEIDIGKIDPGQPVSLSLDAYPDTELSGVVVRIEPIPAALSGITAYPVRVRITDQNGAEVRDGMTSSARVRVGEKENVVLIPNWAIRTDQGTEDIYTYCYCIEDGAPRRVNIETGLRNETWTEVVSGLEAGVTVALVTESQNLLNFQGPPSQGLD